MPDAPLAGRIPLHLRVERGHHGVGLADGQTGTRSGLHRGQPQLLQSFVLVGDGTVRGEFEVRVAAPQGERLGEFVAGAVEPPFGEILPAAVDEGLEPVDVDEFRVDLQDVTGRTVAHPGPDAALFAAGGQRAAQVRHVGLECRDGAAGRASRPQFVDKLPGSDNVSHPYQQQAQQCPVPQRPERQGAPGVQCGQRSEYPQLPCGDACFDRSVDSWPTVRGCLPVDRPLQRHTLEQIRHTLPLVTGRCGRRERFHYTARRCANRTEYLGDTCERILADGLSANSRWRGLPDRPPVLSLRFTSTEPNRAPPFSFPCAGVRPQAGRLESVLRRDRRTHVVPKM